MPLARSAAAAALLIALGTSHAGDSSLAVSPRLHAIDARIAAIGANLATSSDLRLRILFSLTGEVDDERRPDNGFFAHEGLTAASLYEQALGSTDPLVLSLLLHRCELPTKTADRCDRLDLATRWAVADAQNQLAWLGLASVLRQRGDMDAARAAFVRAAQASRWHERGTDVARLVADAAPRDLDPVARVAWLMRSLSLGYAAVDAGSHMLNGFCKEGGDVRTACLRIVDTGVRDGETLITLWIAPSLAARARAPASVVAAYRQKSDAIRWALASGPDVTVDWPESLESLHEADAARAVVALGPMIERSERARGESILLEKRLGEAEAARRWVAGLSPPQRDARASALREARAAGAVSAGSTRSTEASP